MQADEFRSTWVANKAVYRTRMALADGGELLVIAPGLERFGEQPEVDALIRKYGYTGTPRILGLYKTEPDLQETCACDGAFDSRIERGAVHDSICAGAFEQRRDRRRGL